jgi:hypothetical protein
MPPHPGHHAAAQRPIASRRRAANSLGLLAGTRRIVPPGNGNGQWNKSRCALTTGKMVLQTQTWWWLALALTLEICSAASHAQSLALTTPHPGFPCSCRSSLVVQRPTAPQGRSAGTRIDWLTPLCPTAWTRIGSHSRDRAPWQFASQGGNLTGAGYDPGPEVRFPPRLVIGDIQPLQGCDIRDAITCVLQSDPRARGLAI